MRTPDWRLLLLFQTGRQHWTVLGSRQEALRLRDAGLLKRSQAGMFYLTPAGENELWEHTRGRHREDIIRSSPRPPAGPLDHHEPMEEPMNAIVPFEFETARIRVQVIGSEPWFVAIDLCRALGIGKHRDATLRLDEDERGPLIVDTPGGPQTVVGVNESGMWKLVLRSRKPGAERLVKWLTSKVLPSIRQTGTYGAPAPALDLQDAATLHRLLLDHTGQSMAVEARLAALEPKAQALDQLTSAEGLLCVTDAAKALGVPQRRLFAWLEASRWIYRRSEAGHWVAFGNRLDGGWLVHKGHKVQLRGRPDKWVEQVMVTPKGLAKLAEMGAGR